MTEIESINIIKKTAEECSSEELDLKKIISISNHSAMPHSMLSKLGVIDSYDKFYRFTTKTLSMSFVTKLYENDKVQEVMINAAHPPPGAAPDSISLRYKFIIKYY